MALTTAQYTVLKTWLLANAGSLNDQQAAEALNGVAAPPYYIYRTAVSRVEIQSDVAFDWALVDNLTVGAARVWEWMFQDIEGQGVQRTIDFSMPNIRAGVNQVWGGTAQKLAVRAAVYTHSYHGATIAEQLLATGAGVVADGNGLGPGAPGFTGTLSGQDVTDAYNHG